MTIRTSTALLLVLFLTLAACSKDKSSSTPQTPELPQRVATLMGGAAHAQAILKTGKATVYRIKTHLGRESEKLGPGVPLTPQQRTALAALLARDDAYVWDIGKGCEPMPGVLITFEDGATLSQVQFCFGCQMVGFNPGRWEDFDPINKELVDWVKGVFPDDKAIQSLGTSEEQDGL